MNTLSNRRYLITHSTMQGLCLNNNKRQETMNGYFLPTTDSNIIQTPEAHCLTCFGLLCYNGTNLSGLAIDG